MIAATPGGALPPPWDQVVTAPEVAASLITLTVVMLGVVVVLGKWLQARVEKSIREMAGDAKTAASAATVAAEQVQHNHGSSMRDELSRIADRVEQIGSEVSQVVATQAVQGAQMSALDDTTRSLGHQVGELRKDLADERADRRAGDARD
jgi:low affinity Fe/Cu permease